MRTRRWMGTAILLLVALPCAAGSIYNRLNASLGGGISAKVRPIDQLERVVIVEPTTYKVYQATIDRKSGTFKIKGLAPGRYALLLKFRTTVVEGIHLDVPGGYKAIDRNQLTAIEHVTWISDDFFNDKTIARMGGNAKRVKMLVEQVRDKPILRPDGTPMTGLMVRRIELTEMRKTGQIWTIKKTRHLFREERKIGPPGTKIKFIYRADLGKIRVGEELVELPAIDLAKLKDKRPKHFYSAHYREKKR